MSVKFNDDGTVTITQKEFEDFLDDRKWRRLLEAGGVDNWEWYHESLSEGGYYDDEDDDDDNPHGLKD